MKNIHDKYNAFYESVKDFAIGLNLADYSDFKGVEEQQILGFENIYTLKLPLSIKIFLKYFGEKIDIKSTSTDLGFTISRIREAIQLAKKMEVTSFLKNNKLRDYDPEVEGSETDINQLINVGQIQYLRWNDTTQGLTFIDATQENPILYYLMEFKLFATANWSFTNYLRVILFLAISLQFYEKNLSVFFSPNNLIIEEELKPIRLNWPEWAQFYTNIFKTKSYESYKIRIYRLEFYSIISEIEAKEDRIYTMDEFEWAFINYLKEKDFIAYE